MNSITVKLHGSDEPYLTLSEIEEILRIGKDTLGDWGRRYADFPALRLPGSIRVRASELEKWLEKFNSPLSEQTKLQEKEVK